MKKEKPIVTREPFGTHHL